jgi:hypothetical protein
VQGAQDHEKQVQIDFWQRAAKEGFSDERVRHAGIRQSERPASPFAATARRRAPRPGRQDRGNGRWLLAAIAAYLG